MGFSLEEAAALAASKTKRRLEDSGQIGKVEEQYPAVIEFSYLWEKELLKGSTLGITIPETAKMLEIGHTNYVYWDGKLYVCESEFIEQSNGITTIGIGNVAKYQGNGDTGEPFLFRVQTTAGTGWKCNCYDELTTHTFKICDKTETIHPIDPKYLPGVCLPVVDINVLSPGTSETYLVLDKESCDNLTSAFQKQMPIVVRMSALGAVGEVFVASIRLDDSIPVYIAYTNAGRLTIKCQPGIEASDWFVEYEL